MHDSNTHRDNRTIDVGSVDRRIEKEKKVPYGGEDDDDRYQEVPRQDATTTTGMTDGRGGVAGVDIDGSRSMGDMPPKYEDVAGPVGFEDKVRRNLERGKNEERVVR